MQQAHGDGDYAKREALSDRSAESTWPPLGSQIGRRIEASASGALEHFVARLVPVPARECPLLAVGKTDAVAAGVQNVGDTWAGNGDMPRERSSGKRQRSSNPWRRHLREGQDAGAHLGDAVLHNGDGDACNAGGRGRNERCHARALCLILLARVRNHSRCGPKGGRMLVFDHGEAARRAPGPVASACDV